MPSDLGEWRCHTSISAQPGGHLFDASSHALDRLEVTFDDVHAVANAGLLLPATLTQRLGLEALADELVDLGGRPGGAHPGRKLLTLVHAMVAGADCIDDVERLRSGATAAVLGHRFGHVRQLNRVAEAALTRAWALGAGPGGRR